MADEATTGRSGKGRGRSDAGSGPDDAEGRAALKVLSGDFDLPPPQVPVRSYVICASPRSGSTLLTTLLHGSGRMGVPAEYLNPNHLQPVLARRFGAATDSGAVMGPAYLRALAEHRTSPNGVFGIKILLGQLQSWIGVADFRALLDRSTLLWLRRRDQLGQALSMALAQGTQVWHLEAGAPDPRPRARRFDAGQVRRALGIVMAEDHGWQQFFAANRVDPMTVEYEDLVADPDATCRALAAAVGVHDLPPMGMERAITRPTAGEVNEDWRRRWLQSLRYR